MTVTRNALLQMFAAERGRIVGLVSRIVGCRATAEDLAQDTLVRLWDRPMDFRDRSLLFRTAQNLAFDHLRGQRVRSNYSRSQIPIEEEAANELMQPDTSAAASQEFDIVAAALRGLQERTQRIFLLNRLDGLSYSGIAKYLGISVSTVEKEMMRALDACRSALERQGPT